MDIRQLLGSKLNLLYFKKKHEAADLPVLGRADVEHRLDEDQVRLDEYNYSSGQDAYSETELDVINEELPSVNKKRGMQDGQHLKILMLLGILLLAYFAYYMFIEQGSTVNPQAVIAPPPPPPPPIENKLPPLVMPTPTVVPAPVPVVPVAPPPEEADWVKRKIAASVLLDGNSAANNAQGLGKEDTPPPSTLPVPLDEIADDSRLNKFDSRDQQKSLFGGLNNKQGQDDKEQEEQAELSKNIKPLTITRGVEAGILANRNYMIAKGTTLDCALETALDSTLAGLVTCRLTRDVYSDNGKVIMLDRGSQLIGEYKSGVNNGIVRIFVLWTRAKTPKGVVVELNSPGTDSLGRTGLEGYVDNHFIERYGSALMLSAVQEYLEQLRIKNGGATTVTMGAGATTVTNPQSNRPKILENIANDALQKNMAIPPVLYINQGASIQVMVVRDLDFSKVYGIENKRSAE